MRASLSAMSFSEGLKKKRRQTVSACLEREREREICICVLSVYSEISTPKLQLRRRRLSDSSFRPSEWSADDAWTPPRFELAPAPLPVSKKRILKKMMKYFEECILSVHFKSVFFFFLLKSSYW